MPQLAQFSMMSHLFGLPLMLGLILASVANSAIAQSYACQSIRTELANLGLSDPRAATQANRARTQVQRIAGYMASIGCDRQRVLIFGASPPPECGSLRSQLQQAQSDLASAEAATGDNPTYTAQRRRELQAALQSYGCSANQPYGAQQPLPPGYDNYGRLGNGYSTQEIRPEADPLDPESQLSSEADNGNRNIISGKPVCVRTCDGYFFPLDVGAGRARSDGEALCQALCPGAETNIYFMTPGADIDNAVNTEGQNYTALPTAFRYRQSLQSNCACKGREETWASLLKPAEGLLGNEHAEDVTVTPEKSLELSRPTALQKPKAPDQSAAKPSKAAKPDRRTNTRPPPTAGDQSQMDNLTVDGNNRRPAGIFPPILRGEN